MYRPAASILILCGSAALFVSAPLRANAQLSGTQVTGHIYFDGGFTIDGYDPNHGAVPPGYENTAGNTVTISDTAVEFGFSDSYNFDTADFTDLTLTLSDQVNNNGAVSWEQTFTDPDFSGVVTPVADTFDNGGVTANVSGDTLIFDWVGTDATNVTYTAVFNVGSVLEVPEPSTWALLAAGGMLLAVAGRRQLAA